MTMEGVEKFTKEVLATIDAPRLSSIPIPSRRTIMHNLSSVIFLRKILQTMTPNFSSPKRKTTYTIHSFIDKQLKIIKEASQGAPLSILLQMKYQLYSQLPPEAKELRISITPQLLEEFSNVDLESLGKITEELQSIDWVASTIGDVKSDEQSSVRRITGSYYTPRKLVDFSLKQSFDHHLTRISKNRNTQSMQKLMICDPACGDGAFLLAIASHIARKESKNVKITQEEHFLEVFQTQIHGADLNPIALFSLAAQAWIQSGRPNLSIGKFLANFRCGNSLLWCKKKDVSDQNYSSAENFYDKEMSKTKLKEIVLKNGIFQWNHEFPEIFSHGGFDVVIGNPPWERVKFQLREFFRPYENLLPEKVTNQKQRGQLREELLANNPDLKMAHDNGKSSSEKMSRFLTKSGEYPLTGSGDVNLYSVFAELSQSLVRIGGLISLIIPTKIATGKNNQNFFEPLITEQRLMTCLDIENKRLFNNVHSHERFSVLSFTSIGSKKLHSGPMVSSMLNGSKPDTWAKEKIRIKWSDFKRFNPNSKSIILPSTKDDYELLSIAYANCPILWRGYCP